MMASFWQQMPFVRLIIPFIAGIVCQLFLPLNLVLSLILLISSALIAWIGFLKINNYSRLWWPGIFVNILLFFFGSAITYVQNYKVDSNYLNPANNSYYIVKIDEPIVTRKNSYKARAVVIEVIDSLHNAINADMNLMIYFKKDSSILHVQYGDLLLIKSQLLEISLPKNPGEFNFKNYLAFKHIHLQTYLSSNQFTLLPQRKSNRLYLLAYQSQEYIKKTLQQYVSGKNEMGVGEALLFGFDDDIDPQVFKSYSHTGTLHVLAVSGMHVGLIFMVLSFLLNPLQKIKQLRFLKPVLVLTGVWLYSLLCGLSPSILRATIMISFLVTGEVIKRRSNAFNSLAASAFLLLMCDTSMIANVGFQLSYAAVLGIIAFYKSIYELFDFKTRFGDAIWKVIAVSLAAQALTFPMSLYYFHQFPNYFLVANLLIIPVTTLVIYTGILLLVFSKIYILAYYLGSGMQALIYISNYMAQWIEQIPYSYTDNIFISAAVTLLIYGFGLFILIYFHQRDLLFFKLSLLTLLLICFFRTQELFQQLDQKKLLIYSIKDHIAIQLLTGKQATLIADSGLIADQVAKDYHLKGFICESGINIQLEQILPQQNTLIKIDEHKTLVVLIKNCNYTKGKYEWALVSGKQYLNLEVFLKNNIVKNLLLNPDIPFRKKIALKKIASTYQIPCYDIAENGAIEVLL
ncbi:MAG: ComEC/Rec2 family competence protein [Bacteroidia bacterium]|nr:ComEC/Rec2 family competence protein [Bacteroidia bacterium]